MTCPPHWWVGTGEKRGNTHELFRCRRCGGTCWLPITWDAVMKEKKKPQKGLRPQPKRDPTQVRKEADNGPYKYSPCGA